MEDSLEYHTIVRVLPEWNGASMRLHRATTGPPPPDSRPLSRRTHGNPGSQPEGTAGTHKVSQRRLEKLCSVSSLMFFAPMWSPFKLQLLDKAFLNTEAVSSSILSACIIRLFKLELGFSNIVARLCHPLVVTESLLKMTSFCKCLCFARIYLVGIYLISPTKSN